MLAIRQANLVAHFAAAHLNDGAGLNGGVLQQRRFSECGMVQTVFVRAVRAAVYAAACFLAPSAHSSAQAGSPAEHAPIPELPPAWANSISVTCRD